MLASTSLSEVMSNVSTATAGFSGIWVIGAIAMGVFLALIIIEAVVDMLAKKRDNNDII